MMWPAFVVLAVIFVLWRRHRHGVKERHAGLQATAPTFHTEPPHRRHHDRMRERL